MARQSCAFVISLLMTFPCLGASIDSVVLDRDPVPQYDRLELKVLTESTYTNPFDPIEIDLWGEFISPSGTPKKVNGFWDGENWKIRFAGGETGSWDYTVYMKDIASTASKAGSFIVSQSGHHGWIGVSEKDRHYLEHTDDTPFYGVGFCRPWNIYRKDDPNLFADMQKNGCNLFVLWLAKWDDMMLVNNTTGYDRYDMSSAAKLDTIFKDIESRDINVVLTVWYHGFLRDETHSWRSPHYHSDNPFRVLSSATEFFSSEKSWEYQEKLYRYMIARWGYSRSLAMWHTICEATGSNAIHDPIALSDNPLGWHNKINNYFAANDPFHHPTTGSKHGDKDWHEGFKVMDCPQLHSYDHAKDPVGIASRMAYWHDQLFVRYAKPGWMGEFGIQAGHNSDETNTNFVHNGIWAGLVTGAATTPMQWSDGGKNWGKMSPNMYAQLKHLRKFIDTIPLTDARFQPAQTSGNDPGLSTTVPDSKIWGLTGDGVNICWLQDTTPGETVSGGEITIKGLYPGTYEIDFFNTWTGQWMESRKSDTKAGVLVIPCPDFAKDIALRITHTGRDHMHREAIEDFVGGIGSSLAGNAREGGSARVTFNEQVNEPASSGGSCRVDLILPTAGKSSAAVESGNLGGMDWSHYDVLELSVYLPENTPYGLTARLVADSGTTQEPEESNYSQRLMAGKWSVLRIYKNDFENMALVNSLGVRFVSGADEFSGSVYIDSVRGIRDRQ